MIYTVTLNPSIDYVMTLPALEQGRVCRSESETVSFGGKGINVSAVLAELGVRSVALGFIAGFTGDEIERLVREKGVDCGFIRLESGMSRINVKLRSGQETELNANGPFIGEKPVEELMKRLDGLSGGDTLVLAGSVPSSVPSDIYERIMSRLSGRNIRYIVDASGELLVKTLKYEPFLIKPNDHELSEIFGVELRGRDDIIKHANKLREMGAKNVLVSMAGDGALLVGEDLDKAALFCPACKGSVVNSVGAGDSMVAGFIAGLDKGFDHALKLGTAAGGATAFSQTLAKRNEIERLFKQIV